MDDEKGTKNYKDRKRENDGGDVTNGDEDKDERRVRKLWVNGESSTQGDKERKGEKDMTVKGVQR
jgi:hypothetical protein